MREIELITASFAFTALLLDAPTSAADPKCNALWTS